MPVVGAPPMPLVMQARLPRPITWAMWPTALASPSNGMHSMEANPSDKQAFLKRAYRDGWSLS